MQADGGDSTSRPLSTEFVDCFFKIQERRSEQGYKRKNMIVIKIIEDEKNGR